MRKDKKMKRWTQKAVILAVSVVIMLIAGCEKENPLAKENMQLKEQLEQRDKEIEKQKELLAKCLQEKDVLKENSQKNVREQVESILVVVMEENVKLREENDKLKTQIERLEVHVQQLEKELKKKSAVPQPL
jgi:outer membrane murein-binding lipoprotein Lpp